MEAGKVITKSRSLAYRSLGLAGGDMGNNRGTWDDIRRNDQIQEELEKLAKSGNDIRDRGAFIDALCSNYDGFVTSDKQFIGSGPVRRINERFSTKVISPEDLLEEIGM